MELVAGKTLREVLFSGPLPVKRLLQVAAQIADGVARAHEAGIVHRDLKPEKRHPDQGRLVKILDFGLLAKLRAAHATLCGYPASYVEDISRDGRVLVTTGTQRNEV